jgi:hypothetical protein
VETKNLAAKHDRAAMENLAAKFFQAQDVPEHYRRINEDEAF